MAFRVIREAMREMKRIAIGRVVISNREHIVALAVQGNGFVLTTLRYAAEVRSATPYFEDIKNGDVSKDELALAKQLIEHHTREFDPAAYQLQFPNCDILNGDMNRDGAFNGADIDPFFTCLGGGNCP